MWLSFSLLKFSRVIWVPSFFLLHAFFWYILVLLLSVSCVETHASKATTDSHFQILWPSPCFTPFGLHAIPCRLCQPALSSPLVSVSQYMTCSHSARSLLFFSAPQCRHSLGFCARPTQHAKISSNWVGELNVKSKSIKTDKWKQENLCDLEWRFLRYRIKSRIHKRSNW